MVDNTISISRRARAVLVTCLLVVFALQLIHVARVYSTNWDEAHHLYDGYNIWTKHDYRLNAEVPPLVKLMAALPLLPMHLAAPPDPGKSQAQDAFLDGRAFVFGNGGDRVLFPARMACIMLTLLAAWLTVKYPCTGSRTTKGLPEVEAIIGRTHPRTSSTS